jgi:hypothetical protein
VSLPSVGSYVPQFGPTVGAKLYINGRTNIPQPTWVKYNPPELAFKTIKGRPIYQGLPEVVVHWDNMDIDGFQALSVEFFTALNSVDGPIVELLMPNPAEAGRYDLFRAYLEWPNFDQWRELQLKDCEARLSSVSLAGQGLWF